MARIELPNGIILPAEYSDDWYDDMTLNLTKLDDVIGSDADKLSEADVGAAALSNDYTDLDNKPDLSSYDQHLANTEIHVTAADKQKWNDNVSQSYVLRYASTSVTPSSTISYSVLNNTDNIKAGDSVIDSSGRVFLIASVDTVNETVTVSAVLLTLALDSNVMHLSGDETAPGKKTFADLTTFNSWLYFTNSSVTKGTIPQSTVNPYRIYFGSGVNYGASLFNIDTSVSNTGVQTLTLRSAENVVNGDDTRLMLTYDPNRAQPRYLSVKGNIEPNANNTYECGTSSNIWKDLYAYHGYFCGLQKGDEYSSNTRTNLCLMSNRDAVNVSGILFDTYRQNTAQGTGIHILGIGIKENSVRYEGCRWGWYWDNNLNGYYFDFKPTTQGANQAVKHNLGTSTDKWDTINGLNPGALSLPDLSAGLDIGGYLTNAGTTTPSEYTPTVDGWLVIAISADSPAFIRVFSSSGVDTTVYSERNELGSTSGGTYTRYASITVPCRQNDKQNIIIMPSTMGIVKAKFYPNLGNV